ncbi:hypothetical protein G6F47_006478 [Rhizopus delemar]|nr:hypothetical protein G6F48_008909 [Rhizopus delemar]KAG1598370.1 hypothetical protein G6F47_006478 [Rhizopus delemar]
MQLTYGWQLPFSGKGRQDCWVCSENTKRLAIYAWYQAKQQDEEAKGYALKALRLPPSLKHLETKSSRKREAFNIDFLREYNTANHQHKLDKAASGYVGKPRGNFTPWSQYRGGKSFSTGRGEKNYLGRRGRGTSTFNNSTSHNPTYPTSVPTTSTVLPITALQQQSLPSANYEIPTDGIAPGGLLQQFITAWRSTITHPWPLSVIQHGYKIQFAKQPVPWKLPKKHLSAEDQLHVNIAIQKFLTGEMIEVSPSQNKNFLSNFFTLQEQTKRRPILDRQKLNRFLQVEHFQMEGVPTLREIIEENDYICKIDLKDAYVVIPIHPDSQDYLSFENQGTVYRYKSLAFGLSVAP